MAVQVSYPGVYIQEVSSGVRTITGVSTSVAMFVGFAQQGPLGRPTQLFSFADYLRAFGPDTSASEMATQVRLFFQNGGERCYVMRIADNASAATLTMSNEAGAATLQLAARNPGTAGNRIRAEVDYATPTPNSTFNLRVFVETETSPGVFGQSEVERFVGLSMDPASGRYVVDVLASDSALVVAIDPGGVPIAGPSYSDRLFDDDDALLDLLDDGRDMFRISADGGATFFDAVLPDPLEATGLESVQEAINGTGLSVTVTLLPVGGADPSTLRFVPAAGAVRILPASDAGRDLASLLGLGATQGGIEFGTHADRRPAPTGTFFTPQSDLTNLHALAVQTAATLTNVTITDGTSGSPYDVPLTLAPAGALYAGGVTTYPSYSNVRGKLNQIAGAVNAAAAGSVELNWAVDVEDVALVFRAVGSQSRNFTGTVATVAAVAGFGQNARFYSFGVGGLPATFQFGLAGADGNAPTHLSFYEDAYQIIEREVDLFNLLVLPRAADADDDVRRNLWGPASVFCQRRRAFLLVDPPHDWATVADILTDSPTATIAQLRQGMVNDHAAVYWPRVTAVDSVTGLPVRVDPSGSVAGIMARIDGARGVWKAAAGIEATVRAVQGLERSISDPENGVINQQAVNALRVFPNGIVVWGARTMDGFDNSGNTDYRYGPVRRFALFIEESLVRGLKFAVFEPNGDVLWAQIRLAAGAFMNNLFRQGAFAGTKASDAYFVLCDSTTTTQNDINLGIVNVVIGFAPLHPAEFVVITLQQKAGEIQV